LRNNGWEVFAPVEQVWDKEKEGPEVVMQRNINQILVSEHMLAQLDYLLMPAERMGIENTISWKRTELCLPDSGTVWEMGYASALGKQVFGYTVEPVTKLNLMLSQTIEGVVKPLKFFGPNATIDWGQLEKYEGSNI